MTNKLKRAAAVRRPTIAGVAPPAEGGKFPPIPEPPPSRGSVDKDRISDEGRRYSFVRSISPEFVKKVR